MKGNLKNEIVTYGLTILVGLSSLFNSGCDKPIDTAITPLGKKIKLYQNSDTSGVVVSETDLEKISLNYRVRSNSFGEKDFYIHSVKDNKFGLKLAVYHYEDLKNDSNMRKRFQTELNFCISDLVNYSVKPKK